MVLIDAKADVQAFDKYQWIPFHLDKTGVATVLIDAKADVQAFDKYHVNNMCPPRLQVDILSHIECTQNVT